MKIPNQEHFLRVEMGVAMIQLLSLIKRSSITTSLRNHLPSIQNKIYCIKAKSIFKIGFDQSVRQRK